MRGAKRRKAALGGVALVAAALAVWQGARILGGPVGQEAARLAAADLLGVHPDDLQVREDPLFPRRRYKFLLKRDGRSIATVSVSRESGLLNSGLFYGRGRKAGERRLDRAAALTAARRFADEHFDQLGALGRPEEVKARVRRNAPLWDVTWNIVTRGEPWRFLSVTLNGATGEVVSFIARKGSGPAPEPIVSQQQAIATARAYWQAMRPETTDVITQVKATILRGCPARPDGYPVWNVAALSIGSDGLKAGIDCIIDAITGEVIPPPRLLPRATVDRARAMDTAIKSLQKELSEGWVCKGVSAKLDSTGKWAAPGHPVWEVRVECTKYQLEKPFPVQLHTRLIDGMSREVISYPETKSSEAATDTKGETDASSEQRSGSEGQE